MSKSDIKVFLIGTVVVLLGFGVVFWSMYTLLNKASEEYVDCRQQTEKPLDVCLLED